MAKIDRKTARIFGLNAVAAPLGIAQFGSLANGSVVYSTDPNVVQALSQWLGGWNPALVGGASPALEDVNAVDYVSSYQIAYLLQQGVPEYDASTTYYTNSFCSYVGQIYQSIADTNLGNTPSTSPSNWQLFSTSAKGDSVIINGGMAVAQRGTSGTVTAGSNDYTLDGWKVHPVANNVAWSQGSDGADFYPYNLTMTASGNVSNLKVTQRIEADNALSLGLKPTTFQMTVLNNSGVSLTPKITVNGANALNNFSAVTPYITATNLQMIPDGQSGVISYCVQFSAIGGSNLGVEIIIDFGVLLDTMSISVGNVDFSSTPFFQTGLISFPPVPQIRPTGVELQNCRRYFRSFRNNGFGANILSTGALRTSSVSIGFPVALGVKMRVAPVVSYSNLSDFAVVQAVGPVTVTPGFILGNTPGDDDASSEILPLTVGVSTITVGAFCELVMTAGGSLLLSAEL